jgi:integrase
MDDGLPALPWSSFADFFKCRISPRALIEDFLFHDLRHCAVTNPADSGVDTDTIMKLVGHSSVVMFLRYRTIKAETLDAAMTRLNTLITRYENAAWNLCTIE